MLTIICGEDSISSRNYFLEQQKIFIQKGYEIVNIDYRLVIELEESGESSASLFTQKRVYFTTNLNKKVLKKLNIKTEKKIKEIIKSVGIQLFDWEQDSSSRD